MNKFVCIEATVSQQELHGRVSLYKTEEDMKLQQHQQEKRLYKTLVTLVLLYGCETWTINIGDEKRIDALQNNSLRQILKTDSQDQMAGQNYNTRNTTIIKHETTEPRNEIQKMEIHNPYPQKRPQQ